MSSPERTDVAPNGRKRAVDRFVQRASALGVVIHQVGSEEGLAGLIAELTGEGALPVVLAAALDVARPMLHPALVARGVVVRTVDPADPGAAFAGALLGVSPATLGVAETGSLVMADQLPDRLVRMLAPTHLVVVPATAIVPGLDEAGEWLREAIASGEAAYVSFVTGPSRTADIEMSLTVGAHGPAELHIAILDTAQP